MIENEGNGKSHFSVSVSENATEGIFRGYYNYKVAFTSDGTAAFETRVHEATLGTVRELFGRVLTVEEVIRELGDSPDKN